MYSGLGYVVAAYSFIAVMLLIWFAMIIRRYRHAVPTSNTAQHDD